MANRFIKFFSFNYYNRTSVHTYSALLARLSAQSTVISRPHVSVTTTRRITVASKAYQQIHGTGKYDTGTRISNEGGQICPFRCYSSGSGSTSNMPVNPNNSKPQAPQESVMNVFDRKAKRIQRNRTALLEDPAVYDYIKEEVGKL